MSYIKIILLVIGLLFAQTATVIHASDHLFHEHSNDCASYIAAQHNNASVPVAGAFLNVSTGTDEQGSYTSSVTVALQQSRFFIRAPPVQYWLSST